MTDVRHIGAVTLANLRRRVVGVGTFWVRPDLDGYENRFQRKPPEWAVEVGLCMSDPMKALERIREAERQNRAYLKEHARSWRYDFGCRLTIDMTDCLSLAEAEHLDQRLYISKAQSRTYEADSIQLGVSSDGSVHFNTKKGRDSLWTSAFGFPEIKLLFFGAALPKAGRLSAATCAKQLKAFLLNVRKVNADPESLYRVQSVHLFGSYLKGAQSCGDVDVVADICERKRLGEMTPEEFRRKERALPRPDGQSLKDSYSWARTMVKRELKAGASRVMIAEEQPEPFDNEEAPLMLYQRGTHEDIPAALRAVAEARARWATPEMQSLRERLTDLACAANTDPDILRANAVEEERWMQEMMRKLANGVPVLRAGQG